MSRNTCHEQTTSKPIHAEVFQFNVVHKRNPAGTGADLQGIGMDLAISNVSQEPAWSTAGDEPGSWQQFLGLSPQLRQLRQSSQVILTLSNDILNVFAIQLTDHLCEGIESVNRVTPALTDCAVRWPFLLLTQPQRSLFLAARKRSLKRKPQPSPLHFSVTALP